MIPAADVHTKNNAKIIFSTLQVVGQHYYLEIQASAKYIS